MKCLLLRKASRGRETRRNLRRIILYYIIFTDLLPIYYGEISRVKRILLEFDEIDEI